MVWPTLGSRTAKEQEQEHEHSNGRINDEGIVTHSLVTFFSKRPKTLQPDGTLGNWRRSIVAVIHVCTSFPRGSSIDGIICQKRMLTLSR